MEEAVEGWRCESLFRLVLRPRRRDAGPDGNFDDRWDAVNAFRREVMPALPDWARSEEVLDALTELASRSDDESSLRLDAAETLALVWLYKGRVDHERFARLRDDARAEVRAYFDASNRADLLDRV